MKYFFDTEFYEDGYAIHLISIGIVGEDGREYYAETTSALPLAQKNLWLIQNVLPHLSGPYLFRGEIAKEIIAFVGEKPEFWAYYADYDWVALCQLYGSMIDLPEGWPMFCHDLKQYAMFANIDSIPIEQKNEHNALADARWVRDGYNYVKGYCHV